MSRTDDVINTAGHRLSTGAMEEVLASHPDVAECAVVGVADDFKGQVPVGFAVLKAGVDRDAGRDRRRARRPGARADRPGRVVQDRARRPRAAQDPLGQGAAQDDPPDRRRRALGGAGRRSRTRPCSTRSAASSRGSATRPTRQAEPDGAPLRLVRRDRSRSRGRRAECGRARRNGDRRCRARCSARSIRCGVGGRARGGPGATRCERAGRSRRARGIGRPSFAPGAKMNRQRADATSSSPCWTSTTSSASRSRSGSSASGTCMSPGYGADPIGRLP